VPATGSTAAPPQGIGGPDASSMTCQMAAFIQGAAYADLPDRVVAQAKASFLDTLGITLAAVREPAARIVTDYARDTGGVCEASMVGSEHAVPAAAAARVNAVLAHVVGFSDFSGRSLLHPSVAVLPAVWALGEATHAKGSAIVLAHVIGTEVSCKLAQLLTPDFTRRGFHPCAVVGTFGAAAASATLLGLDAAQTANALGIAAVRAAGIKVSLGTMAKAYAVGNAAEGGVTAAQLAQRGYTGPLDAIEGRDGVLQTFGANASGFDLSTLLGRPYEFDHPGITIKPYPACTRAHPTIDAVLGIVRREGVDAATVERIDCDVSPLVLEVVNIDRPRNAMQAKFSLPFCIAAAIRERAVSIDTFTERMVACEGVRKLMEKVSTRGSQDMAERGPFASTVAVTLSDGRVLRKTIARTRWSDEDGLSLLDRDRLVGKFRACAASALEAREIDVLIHMVDRLDELDDLSPLMHILRRGTAERRPE